MDANQHDIKLRFHSDSLCSVSFNTAIKLVEQMESDSLESLIHLMLRNLAAETGVITTNPLVAYPLKGTQLLQRS